MNKASFTIADKSKWPLRYSFLITVFLFSLLLGFYFCSEKTDNNTSIDNLSLIVDNDDAEKDPEYDDIHGDYEDDYNIYNSIDKDETLIVELNFFPFRLVEIFQQEYPLQEASISIIPIITFLDFWGFNNISNSYVNYIANEFIKDHIFTGKLTPWRTCKLFFLGIKICETRNLPYPRCIMGPSLIIHYDY